MAESAIARIAAFNLVGFMSRAFTPYGFQRADLLERTDVGRDRFDLRLGQAVRNRLHDD